MKVPIRIVLAAFGCSAPEAGADHHHVVTPEAKHADFGASLSLLGATFGNAYYENQMSALLIFAERNPSVTTTDADHNFIDQIRACVWKHHGVFDHTRVRLLTRQHLFEKRLRIGDFASAVVGRQHVHNLVNRVRWLSGPQPKQDLFFIE